MSKAIFLTLLLPFLLISCTKQETSTGEVDAVEVDVGVKIPGRLSSIDVQEGAFVTKGQILGRLESREMEGKMKTVTAMLKEAQDQLSYATKTYNRMKNLYSTNVIAKQQFDEIEYKYSAAKQKVEAIQGQMGEVQAAYDEMLIRSPIDGEVVQIVSRGGEIVSPGYPVITVLDLTNQWATFNIREDRLTQIKKGQEVLIQIPAIGQKIPAEVTYISALGTFAKWKATNEQGSFDLKTFEVRAKPKKRVEELRPGMTVILSVMDKQQ